MYLGDNEGEEILLPNKYCPEHYHIGDSLDVFVYRDTEDRKIATNLQPKLVFDEFALLKVKAVSPVGAFLDWGLEKDLLVPFNEQRQKMVEGRWYIVYLELDPISDRLYASNKIDRKLQNDELSVAKGDQVDVMILKKSDLGYNVIVNNKHSGLVYDNEIFRPLNIGDKLKGFVKKIRPENKLDITLQALGFEKYNDENVEKIYSTLKDQNGFLPLHDGSSPEEIYSLLGISKKAFKKAAGTLYKERKIVLDNKGIRLPE